MSRPAALLAALLAIGCGAAHRIPEPPGGALAVQPEIALSFYQQAEAFYGRLIRRRFNTLETFNDPVLRQHFQSIDLFFDYYADLAQQLADAHFEKTRPNRVQVQEFVFEDRERVRVQIRFVGEDKRPLRPNKTSLIRLDRWEQADGTWWLTPGKL